MTPDKALHILSLSNLKEQEIDSERLRKAYHSALRQAHPDKFSTSSTSSSTHPNSLASLSSSKSRSVDEVKEAYTLLTREKVTEPGEVKARRGYVTIDLDDFEFDETLETWTLACRCGHGYRLTEPDLVAGRDVVGCDGCSLLVKVTYQEITTAADEEHEDGRGRQEEGGRFQ